jgi:hypothetical protein
MPEFDFQGTKLQRVGTVAPDYELITFNLTVLDGRTVAVIGWLDGDDGPAGRFAKSFMGAVETERADAIVRLAFEHLENIYLRPSWWHSLPATVKAHLMHRSQSGGTLMERQAHCLMPDGLQVILPLQIVQRTWN